MQQVGKRFGAVVALQDVELSVEPGEVHALVGENGAGKSTLMNIVSGALAADSGTMSWRGQPYAPQGPLEARRAGIAMIHQELSLAPELSVQANIMLGREPHSFGVLRRTAMREQVTQALQLLQQAELDPERKVSELGPGARQLVEVARALAADASLVVMDEPTSSLAQHDVERLFGVIARLRERGVSVIYISHALEELERIADRYTVLRDGKTVATGTLAASSRTQIITAMVGRELDEIYPQLPHTPGEPVLELSALSGAQQPTAASLTLHRGEIFGIAGLIGAGRSELLRALFGLDPIVSGQVRVAAASDRGLPPWARLAQGIGLLSEQRKEEGLAQALSIADNITLPALQRCSRGGIVRRSQQQALARRYSDELGVRAATLQQPVGTLSGGNQQKVALARLLCCDAEVLLLDEPTRGIDIGSKREIYRRIAQLAQQGQAILMVSSYLPELLGVCDTLAVMRRGRLGPARPVSAWSEADIMHEATGAA
jgi:ribose transport system ATP-binding protein